MIRFFTFFMCFTLFYSPIHREEIQAAELSLTLAEQRSHFKAFDLYEQALLEEYEENHAQADLSFRKSALIFGNLPLGFGVEFYRQDLVKRGYNSGNLKLSYKTKTSDEKHDFDTSIKPQYDLWQQSNHIGKLKEEFKKYLLFTAKKLKVHKIKNRNQIAELLNLNTPDAIYQNRGLLYIAGNFFFEKYIQEQNLSQRECLKQNAFVCFKKTSDRGFFRAYNRLFELEPNCILTPNKQLAEIFTKLIPLVNYNHPIYQRQPEHFLSENQRFAQIAEKLSSPKEQAILNMYSMALGNSKIMYEFTSHLNVKGKTEISDIYLFNWSVLNSYFPALKDFYSITNEEMPEFDIEEALKTYPQENNISLPPFFNKIILSRITDYTQGRQLFEFVKNKDALTVFVYCRHIFQLPNKDSFPEEVVAHLVNGVKNDIPLFIGLLDSIYQDFSKFEEYIEFMRTIKTVHPFTYLCVLDGLSNAYTSLSEQQTDFSKRSKLQIKAIKLMDRYIQVFHNQDAVQVLKEKGTSTEKSYNYYPSLVDIHKNVKNLSDCIAVNIFKIGTNIVTKDKSFNIEHYLELARQKRSLQALGNFMYLCLSNNNFVKQDFQKASLYMDEFIEILKQKLEINPQYLDKKLRIQKIESFFLFYYLNQKTQFLSNFKEKCLKNFSLVFIQKIVKIIEDFLRAQIEIKTKEDFEYAEDVSFPPEDLPDLITDFVSPPATEPGVLLASLTAELPFFEQDLPDFSDITTNLPLSPQARNSLRQKNLHQQYQQAKNKAAVNDPTLVTNSFQELDKSLNALKHHPIKYREFCKMINENIKKFNKGSVTTGKGSGMHVTINDENLHFHRPHGKKDTTVKGGVINSFVQTLQKAERASLNS